MRIIDIDLKKKKLELIPTDYNDLWLLFQLIDKEDEVVAETYRSFKLESGKKVKKKFILRILVENVEFSEYGFNLRIGGKVLSEYEEIRKGSYHTITISPGDRIVIYKKARIPDVYLKLIKESKRNKLLIVSLDNEEATITIYKDDSIRILEAINIGLSKKDPNYDTQFLKILHEISKKIKEYMVKENVKNIILASPLFYKDELRKVLKNYIEELKPNIFEINTSYGGEKGVREALKREEFQRILEKIKIELPIKELREVLNEFYKESNLILIGFQNIASASEMGAIEKLFISEDTIKKLKEQGEFDKLLEIMNNVEINNGKVFIIKRGFEEEEILEKIGGLIAKLRFPLSF